jgi:hypothetical protein
MLNLAFAMYLIIYEPLVLAHFFLVKHRQKVMDKNDLQNSLKDFFKKQKENCHIAVEGQRLLAISCIAHKAFHL